MSEPSGVWGCCTQVNRGGSTLQCTGCENVFHHECLKLEPTSELSPWSCQSCVDKNKNKGQTPTRFKTNVTARSSRRQVQQSLPSTSKPPLIEESVRTIIEDVIKSQMESMVEKFTMNMRALLNQELSVVREDIEGLKNSVAFISNDYDDMIKDKEVTAEAIKALEDENAKLTTAVQVMTARINSLEQHARANNIEIQCVPQKKQRKLGKHC